MIIIILPSEICRLIFDKRFPIKKLIQTVVSKIALTLLLVIKLLSYDFNFLIYNFQVKRSRLESL